MNEPKCRGGLGFRDFHLFNQVLLARQAWRLLTKPNSLCARVLKAKYYPNGSLEDTVFAGNASSTWHAIHHGLDLLKKGLVWRIGNGKSVRIWRDPWLPRPHSYRVITNRANCRLHRVSKLLDDQGRWDEAALHTHFMRADVQEILKIRPFPHQLEDALAWAPDPRGIFSVRSAYKLALNEKNRTSTCATSRAPDGTRAVWDMVWGCPGPPKVRVLAWRVMTNSLATMANMKKRKIVETDICTICGMEREDTFHVFLQMFACSGALVYYGEDMAHAET